MTKERVDVLAFNQGLFDTREQAKRGVMAGIVMNAQNGERFDKPGEKISDELELVIKGEKLPYVSRGGLKLARALAYFEVSVSDKVAIDIGSSTGGFTDVMLQDGAKLVYAVDVGTNQLAWKIRQDSRVVVMEQFNFRYAQASEFTHGLPAFASIDVSFISLALILPALYDILITGSHVVALIKPQFEAGREQIGKNGIIKDARIHESVIEQVVVMANGLGFSTLGLTSSPIKGGHGNIEFLLQLSKETAAVDHVLPKIKAVVADAHGELDEKK